MHRYIPTKAKERHKQNPHNLTNQAEIPFHFPQQYVDSRRGGVLTAI